MTDNVNHIANAIRARELAQGEAARIALGPPSVRLVRQRAQRDARLLRQLERMNVNDETAVRRLVFPPSAE